MWHGHGDAHAVREALHPPPPFTPDAAWAERCIPARTEAEWPLDNLFSHSRWRVIVVGNLGSGMFLHGDAFASAVTVRVRLASGASLGASADGSCSAVRLCRKEPGRPARMSAVAGRAEGTPGRMFSVVNEFSAAKVPRCTSLRARLSTHANVCVGQKRAFT